MVLHDATGSRYALAPEIRLSTKKGRHIPNTQMTQRPKVEMETAKDIVLTHHFSARPRSLSSEYNCMGMIFAARRTCIDPDHLGMILADDGFRRIARDSDLDIGDLVVYRDKNAEVSHVGIVSRIEPYRADNTRNVFVLSQWGRDGEYIHEVNDVGPFLGDPVEYWTDRL